MKAETSRHRQAVATKLKITQTAIGLFKEHGYDAVTVKDICQAAELSIGAFYHHFSSKDDIINVGHEQVDNMLEDRLKRDAARGWRDEILYIMEETGKLLQELGWYFIAQAYRHMLDVNEKYTLSRERRVFDRVKAEIVKAQALGELDPAILPDLYTETILRWVRGIIFDWCLREGGYDLAACLDVDLSLLLDALRRRAI